MRYIPHTSKDVESMLKVIGTNSVEDLFSPISESFRLKQPLNLPNSLSEIELQDHVSSIANENKAQNYKSFLGAGCYHHFTPTIVDYLSMQGGFLTAYTPYQPEISQGTLQSIFEFQTMIAGLAGMEVSNACMYDGATALAESCLMAKRLKPTKSKVHLSSAIHPEYRSVCHTYMHTQDVVLDETPYDKTSGTTDLRALEKSISEDSLAVLVQYPNFFGSIEDLQAIGALCKKKDILFVVCVNEPLSLALLKSPGSYGADIVCGEAQSFGNAPSFGGPHVGFFTTKMKYVRSIPGRIVGETVDKNGKRAYTLTLSTREQHIRRDKATSNICTNEALLATRVTIYLSTVGEQGLKKLSSWNHSLANTLSEKIKDKATLRFKSPFFNELVIEPKRKLTEIKKDLKNKKVLAGLSLEKFYPELKNCLLVCTTELNSEKDIDQLVDCL